MKKIMKFLEKNICSIMIIILVIIIFTSLHNAGYFSEVIHEKFEMNKQPSIVLFHANWCGHCKKMMPEWEKFEKEFHGHEGINVINIESEQKDIMKKHDINGFPTIKYCPSGLNETGNTKTYDGDRNYDGLVDFMKSVIN